MSKKKRTRKIVIIILSAICLAAITTLLIISEHYKGVVKKELPKWFAQRTDSLYTISVKSISVNIFTNNISFKKIYIIPDTNKIAQLDKAAPESRILFTVYIPKLSIKGTNFEQYLSNKTISCDGLHIKKPIISITHKTWCKPFADTTQANTTPPITISSISILEAQLVYTLLSKKDTSTFQIKNCNINLEDWVYNNKLPIDSSKFLYAERATINTDSVLFHNSKGLYRTYISSIDFDSKQKRVTMRHWVVKPTLPTHLFYEKVGHECDIYNLNFNSVEVAQFEWNKLLYNRELIANNIYVNNSSLDIFHSRIPPDDPNSKLGRFPHQLLQKVPIPIHIKKIAINNGSVKYAELNEKTKQTGEIEFSEVDGHISNATNIEDQIAKNEDCTINLKTKFNTYSNLNASFTLKLNDKEGAFAVKGMLTDLEAHQISKQSKALTRMDITALRVQYFDMNVTGNEKYAKGEFTMAYKGLKVKIPNMRNKKKKPNNENDGLLSFIANNVFIYTHNPMPGQELRHVKTYVKRDEYKSFFNLIWKNIFQAAQKTAIRDPKIIELIQKQGNTKSKPAKKERKKGRFKNLFKKKKRDAPAPL